ncbi:MAG: type II toxin-antitoxin system YafQ family toxin [Candidatus Saccharimonadales bacterium]
MLNPRYRSVFKKDVKLAKKRGLNLQDLATVITWIIEEQPLPEVLRNHKLVGEWIGRWECHLAPDWLLIYKLDGEDVIFERTGTHADLFE